MFVEIVFVCLLGTVEKKEHSIRALTSDAQALNAQLLSTRKQHQKELQQRPQVNLILFKTSTYVGTVFYANNIRRCSIRRLD